jgi:quercetin dioxygenase-like cupin family protein
VLVLRPLAMTFSSLLDFVEADLKGEEKRYKPVTSSVVLFKTGDRNMVDQEVIGSQLHPDRFPFQSEGDITLAVRNANYTLGPVMLHIVMKPNASIPAHLHKGMAEALYVVEGDFTNEGKQYQAGTSLHFKAGKEHGPHTTKNGCKLLVLWTERSSKEAADLSDFVIAKKAA